MTACVSILGLHPRTFVPVSHNDSRLLKIDDCSPVFIQLAQSSKDGQHKTKITRPITCLSLHVSDKHCRKTVDKKRDAQVENH